MTAPTDLENLELATVEVVAWGDESNIIGVWEAGMLLADLFTDPDHRAIVGAACALVANGEAPMNETLHRQLMADGWPCWDAAVLLAVDGGRDALVAVLPDADGHRYDALPHLLAKLIEEHERQRLHDQLVTLANRLRFPGGPARVAEALGVAS